MLASSRFSMIVKAVEDGRQGWSSSTIDLAELADLLSAQTFVSSLIGYQTDARTGMSPALTCGILHESLLGRG